MLNSSTSPSPGHIRLATSSPSTGPTTALTLHQIHTLATRAANSHVDILLLPEAYIGGYPRGSAFGCLIGGRSAEGRDEFLKYFESAVDLGDSVGEGAGAGDSWVRREMEADGIEGLEEGGKGRRRGDGTREELERIAAETGVFIVVGLIEKAGGSLYCAVVYVCPQRGMIGKRRKVMPVSPLPPILHEYSASHVPAALFLGSPKKKKTRLQPSASSGLKAHLAPFAPCPLSSAESG